MDYLKRKKEQEDRFYSQGIDYRGKKVRTNRNFGPYLDNKPILKKGTIAVISHYGISSGKSIPDFFECEYDGHIYTLPTKDITLE